MEVGQDPNWICSAKGKKYTKELNKNDIKLSQFGSYKFNLS
jgi:hypothetical protein